MGRLLCGPPPGIRLPRNLHGSGGFNTGEPSPGGSGGRPHQLGGETRARRWSQELRPQSGEVAAGHPPLSVWAPSPSLASPRGWAVSRHQEGRCDRVCVLYRAGHVEASSGLHRKGANCSFTGPGSQPDGRGRSRSGYPRAGSPALKAPALTARPLSVHVASPARPGRCDPSCADGLEDSAISLCFLLEALCANHTSFLLLEPGAVPRQQGSWWFSVRRVPVTAGSEFWWGGGVELWTRRPPTPYPRRPSPPSAPPQRRAGVWPPRLQALPLSPSFRLRGSWPLLRPGLWRD